MPAFAKLVLQQLQNPVTSASSIRPGFSTSQLARIGQRTSCWDWSVVPSAGWCWHFCGEKSTTAFTPARTFRDGLGLLLSPFFLTWKRTEAVVSGYLCFCEDRWTK